MARADEAGSAVLLMFMYATVKLVSVDMQKAYLAHQSDCDICTFQQQH